MTEELVQPDVNGASPNQPAVEIPKEVADKIAASARREAEAKLKEAESRLIALETEKKEREQAEMTALQKLEAQNTELLSKVEEGQTYKQRWETFEQEQVLATQAKMDEYKFTDTQKALVNALPIDKRNDLINELKSAKINPPGGIPTGAGGITTIQDILAMPDGPDKTAAYAKYRKGK